MCSSDLDSPQGLGVGEHQAVLQSTDPMAHKRLAAKSTLPRLSYTNADPQSTSRTATHTYAHEHIHRCTCKHSTKHPPTHTHTPPPPPLSHTFTHTHTHSDSQWGNPAQSPIIISYPGRQSLLQYSTSPNHSPPSLQHSPLTGVDSPSPQPSHAGDFHGRNQSDGTFLWGPVATIDT